MGYRTYIGVIPKKEYNKIKSLTPEQFREYYKDRIDEDGYLYVGVYEFGEELYEFGKYTDFQPPKKSSSTFFKNKELNKKYTGDWEIAIVNKEFILYIIEYYKQKVIKYYKELVDPIYKEGESVLKNPKRVFDSNYDTAYTFDADKLTEEDKNLIIKNLQHTREMGLEWTLDWGPFDINENKERIVSSWKYEYSIFELVRIFKSFDWKKNHMYFYGY